MTKRKGSNHLFILKDARIISKYSAIKSQLIVTVNFQIGLFNQITLENCPGLANLLSNGEDIADLMKLSPEAILLRWVNHHLEQAGVPR